MGPVIEDEFKRLVLRPFATSTTCQNLMRERAGVFHVTDDVQLLARAAVGRFEVVPAVRPATVVEGFVLEDCCRWYEFEVCEIDDRTERVTMHCEVVAHGTVRDFWGLNRGKHAVVEAAILATRLHLLQADTVADEFARLEVLVDKTGGPAEKSAFAWLQQYVTETYAGVNAAGGASSDAGGSEP
jgi:hypothetical protein